jgi:hypothetical protein
VLDLKAGYHQLKLAEESRHPTSFIIPSGSYEFCVAHMGISYSGNNFCQRTDAIFTGVGNYLMKVDNSLTQGSFWDTMMANSKEVLQAARENDVTISEDKLQFGIRVKYAGVIIKRVKVITYPKQSAAIQDFLTHKDVTDV